MQKRMTAFLESMGITDTSSYDLSFLAVAHDPKNRFKVLMTIHKDLPWDYSLLESFLASLNNLRYLYSITFEYGRAPTFENVNRLFSNWYMAHYYNASPFVLSYDEHGKISAKVIDNSQNLMVNEAINDFNSLLSFITYPFSLVLEEDKKEELITKEETPKAEVLIDDGREKQFKADIENAQNEYVKSMHREKYSRKGNYLEVKSIKELYSLQMVNVSFKGVIFSSESKLNRKGKLTGSYGIGDDDSAIDMKAFESNFGLSAEEITGIKVGDYYLIKGRVGPDKFSGQQIVTIDAAEKLPPKPLRDDPEPEKRVELHLHTKMSAMDGVGEMSQYCALAKNMGMDAIAVTDHGDIQAFPDAQNAGKATGLHILYGCEFYMFDPFPQYVFNPSEILLSNARYCVFDTETTGLSSMFDRMTEFGGVLIENGAVSKRFDSLINPGISIPKAVQEKTHITDEMVKDKPTIEELMPQIEEFIKDTILVSHNASFDIGFLNESRKRMGLPPLTNPVIDTLPLSHYLFPDRRYHNLEALYKNLGLADYKEDAAHRADADAESLWNAWAAMLPLLNPKGKLRHCDLVNLKIDEDYFRFAPLLDKVNRGQASIDELNDLVKTTVSDFYKNIRSTHMIALVKNEQGLKDLYALVSMSNTTYLADVPKVPKSELSRLRENLLFGSACYNGEVFRSATYDPYDKLKETMKFYDYIEIQPVENYSYLVNMGEITEERLMEVLKTIVKAADELGIPVCATGDVHYVNPEDKICRDVYVEAKAIGNGSHPLNPPRRARLPRFDNPDQHFRSTREMMDSFKKWLPLDKCKEIIVTNTRAIASQIGTMQPVKMGTFPPNANLPDSAERLREICYNNLHLHYGDNPDPKVKERLDMELDGIIGNGYSVTYYIAHCIIKKANEDGYFVGSRGSVGSSFAATMADITEVNPLAPHYLCPKCKHFEWANDDPKFKNVRSGFDLPDKECPECHTKMLKNGQTIPFQTFLGFKAEKVPDIDLNFPPDYQSRAHAYTRVLLGEKNCYRAGTIETVAEKTAFGFVRGYYEKMGIDPNTVPSAQIAKIANECQGVKRTTGQHPGGIVVIPKDMDVFDFTPYQHPADDLTSDWLTTHYDFHSMHDEVLKLDLLGHVDPLALRKLTLITHKDFKTIPMDDQRVLSLFSSPKELNMAANPLNFATGAVALPEFGTTFVQGLLSKALPKTFNDLLIISGLSHGTDVWNNNAEDIITSKTATLDGVIGCRDDIMNYLISMGVDSSLSFQIMEDVRHGHGKFKKKEAVYVPEMKKHDVPDWYIESCRKIQYLFPRAHATAYVMGAVRMAWYKLYMPLYFYAIYFSVRCDKWDIGTMIKGKEAVYAEIKALQEKSQDRKAFTPKDAEILKSLIAASEMLERGFHFSNIDLYRSDASDFVVDEANKSLIPPFMVLDSLGNNAAQTVVEARKDGSFLSIEDLRERTKLSERNIDDLKKLGALKDLGESNQMSLF